MKLNDILNEAKQIIVPNDFDKKGKKMTYPNMFRYKDVGSKSGIRPETVTVRDTKTGKVYGRRTIFQKNT